MCRIVGLQNLGFMTATPKSLDVTTIRRAELKPVTNTLPSWTRVRPTSRSESVKKQESYFTDVGPPVPDGERCFCDGLGDRDALGSEVRNDPIPTISES